MSGFSDRNKSDRNENSKDNMDEQRLEKEEKLFCALSGVEEELLLRSEQSVGEGKVRRFQVRRVSRIAAACLCFVVAGAMFVAVRDSAKWAGSTGADMAAPQMEYSAAAYDTGGVQTENETAGRAADADVEAVMPEAEAAPEEAAQADMADSAGAEVQQNAADNQLQGAAEEDMSQKQNDVEASEDSAETMEPGLENNSGDTASGESAEAAEDVPVGKAGRHLQKKMTTKGQ